MPQSVVYGIINVHFVVNYITPFCMHLYVYISGEHVNFICKAAEAA